MGHVRASRPPARVLVVEDEARIASFLVKGLSARGYEVECAGTGAEAIARTEEGGFDLQILDLGLPDIDGLEVLRMLRIRGVALPMIILTARTDPSDRAAALELGADAYLTKPVVFRELLAAVRACLPGKDR